jgi:hypothetical protein
MLTDNYFKNKAEEIEEEIYKKCKVEGGYNFLNLSNLLYMTLKEVARDQRYQCVENVMKLSGGYDPDVVEAIQNS